ncbi:MAG: hypothetical protein WC884_01425 [Candidatus Paceibacterota bacterium]
MNENPLENPLRGLGGSDVRAEKALQEMTEKNLKRIAELTEKTEKGELTPLEQEELVNLRRSLER